MEAPDPPDPYQLVYSEAVERRLRQLSDEAFARGDGAAFTGAVKEFDRLLRLYPQFGDPLIDLTAVPGVIRIGTVPPLVMRYGLYEDRRLVLVVAPPELLTASGEA